MFDPDTIAREVFECVLAHYQRINRYLYQNHHDHAPLTSLHSSPLQDDIVLLVRIANGEFERHTADEKMVTTVVEVVRRVVDLLFVPAGGLHSSPIPVSFWLQSGIGQVLTHVQDWLQRDDLISSMVERSILLPLGDSSESKLLIPTLQGKTMPVDFVEGFMGAIIDIFGYGGGAPELLHLSIKDLLPRHSYDRAWRKTAAALNHLYPYYNGKFGTREPVDYVFLVRTRRAMDAMYPQGSAYLAQQIGWSWWSNDYPVVKRYYSNYSLQYLLGSDIAQLLRQTVLPQPPAHIAGVSRFVWGEQQRVRIAARTFAQQIQHRAGIECIVRENERHLFLLFSSCPFCMDNRPDCQILYGVVQRMLLWLYGDKHLQNTVRGTHPPSLREVTNNVLDMQAVQGNSHTIALMFRV